MDLNVIREGIVVCETIFEGSVEQPVDLDFVLPDYCPDIARILKCSITPQINVKQISGDRLNVEGTALIHLCYVSDGGSVRTYENAVPFSNSFNLKSNPEDCLIDVGGNVEYVNCRATSQRRLDVHAAIALSARLTAKGTTEIASGIDGESIESKKKSFPYDNVLAMDQQLFSITEIVEIGKDKPDIKQIFRSEGVLVLADYKAIANKVILKADAIFKVVYLSDTETESFEKAEYSIPVTQIVDLPGIDENTVCDIHLETLSNSVSVDHDAAGDSAQLKFDLKASAIIYAFGRSETPVLLDAYSTTAQLIPSFSTKPIQAFFQSLNETHICKGNLSLHDTGVESVVDIYFECLKGMTSSYQDGKLTIGGKINVCILALDQDNDFLYLERSADYDYTKQLSSGEGPLCKGVGATPVSIGYRMNTSGELEIQAEMRIYASLYVQTQVQCVDAAILEEASGKDATERPGMVIYFADKGEDLWDIARTHSTCVKAIQEENNLAVDVMDGKEMLIIPV